MTEPQTIRLGGQDVPYLLKRSPRRRTIGLKIDRAGLTVAVPHRLSRRDLESVLRDKAEWVLGKLAEARVRLVPLPEWRDGELLPFLGAQIGLCLRQGGVRAQPVLAGEQLLVALAEPANALAVQAKVLAWYRREALACFQERTALYAGRLGVALPGLSLSNARARWGSCNSRGAVRLNWRLVKAPLAQIDYVVAHELAHLVEMNHSPAFWRVVERLCPDYAAHRAALKVQGEQYHIF